MHSLPRRDQGRPNQERELLAKLVHGNGSQEHREVALHKRTWDLSLLKRPAAR